MLNLASRFVSESTTKIATGRAGAPPPRVVCAEEVCHVFILGMAGGGRRVQGTDPTGTNPCLARRAAGAGMDVTAPSRSREGTARLHAAAKSISPVSS